MADLPKYPEAAFSTPPPAEPSTSTSIPSPSPPRQSVKAKPKPPKRKWHKHKHKALQFLLALLVVAALGALGYAPYLWISKSLRCIDAIAAGRQTLRQCGFHVGCWLFLCF
ncbi:uncharacterized protein DSM5745_06730 [Aspergillus mulundensis]|uniref:Uncharacterized protein n=1 Tax=Aspergillus mulundensis TaxID=1810919 RepID=A0A3D8RS02_9EURO|nr:hypothetical protein DSM5745_06730 [Aspergillus mulundensis]RDW76738.1 hypothetical protein DSM5745_06730 [Aspergillus mulundensis]